MSFLSSCNYTAHACTSKSYVIGAGAHLVYDPLNSLNGTLVVDLPIQTSAVDFSLIYRLALQLHAPETLSSLSKSRISLFNTHLALFVRRMT